MSTLQVATHRTILHVPMSALALAAAVAIGVGAGYGVSQVSRPSDVTPTTAEWIEPVPGEFVLGPGLADAPGFVKGLPSTMLLPKPGEFRLGPGLAQPPGIQVPLR